MKINLDQHSKIQRIALDYGDNHPPTIYLIQRAIEDLMKEFVLEEAKWWAGGDHAAKWEDSGCEIENCYKCRRLKELSQ